MCFFKEIYTIIKEINDDKIFPKIAPFSYIPFIGIKNILETIFTTTPINAE